VFSAGHDLKESDTSWHSAWQRELERAWYFYKPLIAGVHGFVGPAANAWLANCDFIIAAAGTRFSLESIRGSGTAALRGTYALWMMQLPMRVVYKLNLVGGWYTAEQALDWQCVQRVVPIEQLEHETRRWAETCARIRTSGYATAKRKLHAHYERRAMLGDEMAAPQGLAEHVFETPPGTPTSFERDAVARGLSTALKNRDTSFDPDIIKV
jgi:enoyl-CoA hydratase/carnithine racemase